MYRIKFYEAEDAVGEIVKDDIIYLSTAHLDAIDYAHHEIVGPHQRVTVESYMEELDDMPAVGDGIVITECVKVQGAVVTTIEFLSVDMLE